MATPTARPSRAKPKKRWTGEKRALIADLATIAKKRNQPPIPERLKDILLSHIGHLLNGGYALALVRDVALALVEQYDGLRGYSKLGQLHMRVRAKATEIEKEAHDQRIRDEKLAPLDPAALTAARDFIAARKSPPKPAVVVPDLPPMPEPSLPTSTWTDEEPLDLRPVGLRIVERKP